jgi:very-short-patch-repair endonuclease
LGYRTDIERLAESALQTLGVAYVFEHRIGRYHIDFALPMLNIALECDGWRHRTERVRKSDAHRDALLQEQGWIVVRIPDTALYADGLGAVRMTLAPHMPNTRRAI